MAIYDEFLNKLHAQNLVAVCNCLKETILAYPNIAIKKKFGLPFFYGKTWICYLNLLKTQEIEICFVRGRELPSKELLNFKKRVMVGGLSYKTIEAIDHGILKLLLDEAISLDIEKPYTFTKNK